MGRDIEQRTDDVLAASTKAGAAALAATGARREAPRAAHAHRAAVPTRTSPAALGAAVTAGGKLRLAGKIRSPVA